MKLKTLLLGSAAAMIAVTGARAADAVVAEPEPVEYVRVCDMYGAGFFYIPGTETCIKFSGYVRTNYLYTVDIPGVAPGGDDSAGRWDYRGRFEIDARNETDYGTLRSRLRFQGGEEARGGGGDADVGIDAAYIELGGFRTGYFDTWQTTFHGYGLPVAIFDGRYGYDQGIFIDYTYAANGFEAAIGIQDSIGFTTGAENPDPYGGIAYGGSWGRVAGSIIYDSIAEEIAYNVSLELTLIEGLTLKGFFDGDDGTTKYVESAGDYAWGVGAAYDVSESLTVYAGYSDGDGDDEGYGLVGVNFKPVPGLRFQPEAVFREDDSQTYILRIQRDF